MKYLSLAKLTPSTPSQGGHGYLLGNIQTKSDIHFFRSGYKLRPLNETPFKNHTPQSIKTKQETTFNEVSANINGKERKQMNTSAKFTQKASNGFELGTGA